MVAGTLILPVAVADFEREGPRRGTIKLTVDDVLAMVAAGRIPEDSTIELLDGELTYVDRTAAGQDGTLESIGHNRCVAKLGTMRERVGNGRRHLRTQSTLVCEDTYAPIPDGCVLRGTIDDYADLPRASDAMCVIEVADSSYQKELKNKLPAYARDGVPQYVIINLNSRTAEVYTDPDVAAGTYRTKITIPADGTLALRVGEAETFDVPLAELLP